MRTLGVTMTLALSSLAFVACGDDDNGDDDNGQLEAGVQADGAVPTADGAVGDAGDLDAALPVDGAVADAGDELDAGQDAAVQDAGADAMADAGEDAGQDAAADEDAGVPEECLPQSFEVTDDDANASYTIDGEADPALTLCRGVTYTFNIDAPGHPFYIKTAFGVPGTGSTYDEGVEDAGTDQGTVTFTVPETAPDTLYYQCAVHPSMTGELNIIDPS